MVKRGVSKTPLFLIKIVFLEEQIMLSNKQELFETATSSSLTYQQKIAGLANAAIRLQDPRELLNYSEKDWEFIQNGMICDLNEGYLLHTPRYIVPDYEVLVEKGCDFLDITPPKDLDELLDDLLMMYAHIPSVTTFPVYIGNLDTLFEPFLDGLTDEVVYPKIKRFLNHIDKVFTDAFVHADIGPKATRAGYLILRAVVELENPVPNMTFNYDEEISDEKFALACVDSCLRVSKPSFSNVKEYTKVVGKHAIVSCYNSLPIGGGAYGLLRYRLGTIAIASKNTDDMINNLLPELGKSINHMMDERIDFVVQKSNFFESNFLVKEGFLARDKFTSMIAIVGLADAVDNLLQKEGLNETFGTSERGDEIALAIMDKVKEINDAHETKYMERTNDHYLLHAQVGAQITPEDVDNTPAHRVKVGEEPILPIHINQASKFYKYFDAGTGDLYPFDQTYIDHPDAVLDIIKGAFHQGTRYITTYVENSDLIRVTGYLVKKSEVEKANNDKAVLRNTTWFGKGSEEYNSVFERRITK